MKRSKPCVLDAPTWQLVLFALGAQLLYALVTVPLVDHVHISFK